MDESKIQAKQGGDDNWEKLLSDFSEPTEKPEGELVKSTETSHELFAQQEPGMLKGSLEMTRGLLPDERTSEIKKAIREVEWTATHGTVAALRESGELTPAQELQARELKIDHRIVSDLMTPEEVAEVSRYANDETEEIKKKKAEEIWDLIANMRRGVTMERAWTPRQERKLDYMVSKYRAWERGEVNTDYPCDAHAIYFDRFCDDDAQSYRRGISEVGRLSYDDVPYTDDELARVLGIPFMDIDVEEFVGHFESERYVFAYGPFTFGDLIDLDDMHIRPYDELADGQTRRSVAWNEPLQNRFFDSPSKTKDGETIIHEGATSPFVYEKMIMPNYRETQTLPETLVQAKVAEVVLPKRRPNCRDLMALATAMGENIANIDDSNFDERQQEILKSLHSASSYMSKYIAAAVRIGSEEAKKAYGKARPTSKEFYEEARTRSEAWTEMQIETNDHEENSTYTKLYEWLIHCEAYYADLKSTFEKEESGNIPRLTSFGKSANEAAKIDQQEQ